jgi:heat shock protein HslJ
MSHRTLLIVVLLVGLVLALAGCASSAPTPAPATAVAEAAKDAQATVTQFALSGTEWQLESTGGPEDSSPAPAGANLTLGFGGYRYAGYSGCNWFQGMFDAKGDSLTLEPPAKSLGGCVAKPEAQKLQSSYLTGLTNVISYAIEDGKLVLYAANKQRMGTMAPLDAVPFEGTTWDLMFYPSADAVDAVPVLPGAAITARFEGGKVTGNAGCNDYTADYKRDDTRLTFGPVAATEKMCAEPAGVMEQEDAYLKMLPEVGAINQFARSIELQKADGTPLLMYHAALEPAQ